MHHIEQLRRENERGSQCLIPRRLAACSCWRHGRRLTGFEAPLMSFSRILPSGVLATSTAVSWVLPPTRTNTRPARCWMLAIRLRKGTCMNDLQHRQHIPLYHLVSTTDEFLPTVDSKISLKLTLDLCVVLTDLICHGHFYREPKEGASLVDRDAWRSTILKLDNELGIESTRYWWWNEYRWVVGRCTGVVGCRCRCRCRYP